MYILNMSVVEFILTLFLNHLMPYNILCMCAHLHICARLCVCAKPKTNVRYGWGVCVLVSCRRHIMHNLAFCYLLLRKPFIRKIVYCKRTLLPYMHITFPKSKLHQRFNLDIQASHEGKTYTFSSWTNSKICWYELLIS